MLNLAIYPATYQLKDTLSVVFFQLKVFFVILLSKIIELFHKWGSFGRMWNEKIFHQSIRKLHKESYLLDCVVYFSSRKVNVRKWRAFAR